MAPLLHLFSLHDAVKLRGKSTDAARGSNGSPSLIKSLSTCELMSPIYKASNWFSDAQGEKLESWLDEVRPRVQYLADAEAPGNHVGCSRLCPSFPDPCSHDAVLSVVSCLTGDGVGRGTTHATQGVPLHPLLCFFLRSRRTRCRVSGTMSACVCYTNPCYTGQVQEEKEAILRTAAPLASNHILPNPLGPLPPRQSLVGPLPPRQPHMSHPWATAHVTPVA